MAKALYEVNDEERRLFDLARDGNVNAFTNYYLRGPNTGTWWLPGSKTPNWKRGYARLHRYWLLHDRPKVFDYEDKEFRTVAKHEKTREYPDLPAFFNNHGFYLLPFARDLFYDRTDTRVVVGGWGCLAYESLIYDAELGPVAIGDLVKAKRQPLVFSWTGHEYAMIWASVPFKKGRADLYRVKTAQGREILVTAEHLFLTDQGYQPLSRIAIGTKLRAFYGDPQQSSWASGLSVSQLGDFHCSNRELDSLYDYLTSRHSDGEQLPFGPESVQDCFPSQCDARGHTQRDLHVDGQAVELEHIHSYLASFHPSKHDFDFLEVDDVLEQRQSRDVSYTSEVSSRYKVVQVPQSSLDSTVPSRSALESESRMEQEQTDVSSWVISLSRSDNYSSWDEVVNIEFVREDDYYDIQVPFYHNYVAEGLVHHNSGKTMNMAASYAVYAAIYEDFLGLSLAPRARQANEFISIIRGIIRGTLFEKRFLLHYTAGPNAIMRIGNSVVGETRIESFPLLDKSEDVLTLTADCGVVDQAERFDILDTVRKDVGSRFRGLVVSSGRSRLGHLTFLANSKYNDMLWNIYDRAEDDPDHYLSLTLKSYDNPYLTDRDLDRYENLVNTDEEREINLEGKRPIGDGKEFSRDVMRRMMAPELDTELKQGIDNSWSGYSLQEAKEVGIWEWMLPYKEGHKYLVISDPGTGNPPHRNAYGILVFDISNFPAEPATLAAYIWGFGRGDILNWATRHAELTHKYHAIGTNGFDATGYQSGYDQWMQILNNLRSEKISLAGNNKPDCLNSAKMLCSAGRIKLPPSISGLWNQLSRYEMPEPPGLRQDLVMTFIMACWWLKRVYWIPLMTEPAYIPSDFTYEEDRYARGTEDRYLSRTPR